MSRESHQKRREEAKKQYLQGKLTKNGYDVKKWRINKSERKESETLEQSFKK